MKTFDELLLEIEGSVKGMQYVAGKGLLCNRVGPANAQKQTHRDGNVAPATRGIWAWPWPYNDYYFSFHQASKYVKKYEPLEFFPPEGPIKPPPYYVPGSKFKELKRGPMKTKQIWWNKPFYSHLAPKGQGGKEWYLWDDGKAFIDAAKRTLRSPDGHRYSIDHLELFLPM